MMAKEGERERGRERERERENSCTRKWKEINFEYASSSNKVMSD